MTTATRERIERIALQHATKYWGAPAHQDAIDAFQSALTALCEEMEREKIGALKAAVAAIYFGDNSDYEGYLWDVVFQLDPEMAALLEKDEKSAYDKLHPELRLPQPPAT